MKNKILKVITTAAALCVGIIVGATTVHAETANPTPGSVYNNTYSGKKEYCPNASEFTVTFRDGIANVTDLEIACTEEYDAVMLPATFTQGDVEYTANYEIDVFRHISQKGKGVVVNGGVVPALEDNLNIDYIRFDNGAKLKEYGHAFRGWKKLTNVDGFVDAIEPNAQGAIDLGNVFSGCTSLIEMTLDFKNQNITMYNMFYGCDKLKNITIKNAKISRIEQFAPRTTGVFSAISGVCQTPMNIVFENITFPENSEGAYLASAFNTITGKITFKNCKAGDSTAINFDRAFQSSTVINVKNDLIPDYVNNCASGSYSGANVEIVGVEAYSANYMFNESVYGIVKLNNFITEKTTSAVGMFATSKVVDIQGIDTWQIGAIDLSQMFKAATVFYRPTSDKEHPYNLEESIKPQLESINLSKAIKANEMMCFANEGYIADYSGLDLSGVDTLQPVTENVPFYTAKVAPSYYKVPYDSVYYQTEDDKTQCGGYKLTRATGVSGSIDGSTLTPDALMTGQCATVRIINALSGDTSIYNVMGGHQLKDYIKAGVDYFSDNSCKVPAVLTMDVKDGNNITIYTQDSGITEDIDAGVSYSFGTTTGNINCTVDGSSDQIRLIDANPKLVIKKENKPDSYVLTNAAKGKAAGQFYDVSILVTKDGQTKPVKTISRNMTITVPLPADYDGNGVIVLHYDKGLDKAPTTLNSSVDENNNTVEFYMSSFSHVAILYNDAETETKEITVKWVDDGNYRKRSGITFNWTANYTGNVTDTGSVSYSVEADAETKLTFDVRKEIMGETLESVDINYQIRSTITHEDEWDADNMTLTLTNDDSTQKENRVVKVDLTDVDDEDFIPFVTKDHTLNLLAKASYEDGSVIEVTATKSLASNFKLYEMPIEVTTVLADGSKLVDITYSVNMPDTYHADIDYDNNTITITKEKDVYDDYIDYTVTGFFNDKDNQSGKRPGAAKVNIRATFGDKEYTSSCSIVCRTAGYTSYSTHIQIPGTCNGIPRDSLTFSPDPIDGYTISIGEQTNEYVFIDFDLEGAAPTTYKKNVFITCLLDSASQRPQQVTLTLTDKNGGNQITRTVPLVVGMGTTQSEIDVPTNDDYIITSVVGFSENYTITMSGLTVTATYKDPNAGGTEKPKVYKQNFTVDINDNDNEDGSRPEKIKVYVSDGKGGSQDFELMVSKGKRFTKEITVDDESAWSITKIEGFPERFKISLSANAATIDYTPEKIKKTVSVKFEGDGDNVDETRPTSVLIYVNNGTTQVANATVDANTNWSANVEVNKYLQGVEAKYTIDCGDVKNYSKTVSEDTITLKFTGTLTEKAQEAENAKKTDEVTVNGVALTSGSGTSLVLEENYALENFDWIDYANRYPDLRRAYGFNKEKLYAHYIRYGIAEGRRATFTGKYNSVNEEILAAYFPDDYKYASITTDTDTTTTTTEVESTESISENTVSGNSIDVAEPTDGEEAAVTVEPTDGVIQNEDGTITEKMTAEDGTVTEITKDAEGNIISTKQYKTGDEREVMSYIMMLLGALFLLAGGVTSTTLFENKRSR